MISDPAATEFHLLGSVEATLAGKALALGGPRQRALLALLVLERGRPVPVDRLADELWHGAPPPGAATTLRSYVARLRAVLGSDAVLKRAAGYAIDAAAPVDVARFERLLHEGREALGRGAAGLAADRLRAALAIWRGPALADVANDGALALEARRLNELRLVCVEERIDADLALGRHAEVVVELEQLIATEPLRERLRRLLVLALARSGRQAEALAEYRRARETLVSELALEPTAELKALERAILRGEIAAATPAEERHNLPAPSTSFVGRDRELPELERLLREARLVTLTGLGGSGKTRLALEAASRQVGTWPDGVWQVDLTPLADSSLLADTIAETLHLSPGPDGSAREALLARLRRAELLLVLDNCEHLASACGDLTDALVSGCPFVHVLATSRVPLAAAGEVEVAVDPLPLPAEDASTDELQGSPSVQLFLDRGRAVQRDVADTPEGLATVARICRELDGIPLAIELAAARAKAVSLDEIAARLGDRFRFLRAWRRVADPRHQTLQATMDWSHALLSEDERTLLRRLSVFAGGFTLDAAAAVCLEGDEERTLDLLGRLVDASLVRGVRYVLLETVRQYAAEYLVEAGERDAMRRRHLAYYVRLVESAAVTAEPTRELVDAVLPHRDNVRAALEYALAVEPKLALRAAAALDGFWVLTSPFEGMHWLEAALARAPDAPLELRAPALRALGGSANPAGRDDVAERAYAEALDAFRALGDERAAAVLLLRLGYAALYRGDLERAHALAQESLDGFRATANRFGESQSLSLLGEVACAQGAVHEGMASMEAGASLAGEVGFAWWRAGMLGKLSDRALEQGEQERAERYAAEALVLSRDLEDRLRVVRGLARLAVIAAMGGDARRAGRLWGAVNAEEARGVVGAWENERDGFEKRLLARGCPEFERGREEGRLLTLDDATSEALGAVGA